MKKVAFILLGVTIIFSACAGNFGKIRKMPSDEAQALTNSLETAWETYEIRFIPDRALLLIPRTGDSRLLVADNWVMVANRMTWKDLIRRNTNAGGDPRAWFPMSGFRKIEGPSGELFGYITHARQDLVSAKVVDNRTMQLFYSITQTSGP